MANQLSMTVNTVATFGDNFRDAWQPGALTIPLGAFGFRGGVQNIGTSAEDLYLGDVAVANQGFVILRNLDSTNFVDWGLNDGGTIKSIGRMLPGEPAIFRLQPSQQLMLKADTASCNVEVKLYRN